MIQPSFPPCCLATRRARARCHSWHRPGCLWAADDRHKACRRKARGWQTPAPGLSKSVCHLAVINTTNAQTTNKNLYPPASCLIWYQAWERACWVLTSGFYQTNTPISSQAWTACLSWYGWFQGFENCRLDSWAMLEYERACHRWDACQKQVYAKTAWYRQR